MLIPVNSRSYLNIEFRKQIAIKNDILTDDVLFVLLKLHKYDFVDLPAFNAGNSNLSVSSVLEEDMVEIITSLKDDEKLYFMLNDTTIFWQFGNYTCVRIASTKGTVEDHVEAHRDKN